MIKSMEIFKIIIGMLFSSFLMTLEGMKPNKEQERFSTRCKNTTKNLPECRKVYIKKDATLKDCGLGKLSQKQISTINGKQKGAFLQDPKPRKFVEQKKQDTEKKRDALNVGFLKPEIEKILAYNDKIDATKHKHINEIAKKDEENLAVLTSKSDDYSELDECDLFCSIITQLNLELFAEKLTSFQASILHWQEEKFDLSQTKGVVLDYSYYLNNNLLKVMNELLGEGDDFEVVDYLDDQDQGVYEVEIVGIGQKEVPEGYYRQEIINLINVVDKHRKEIKKYTEKLTMLLVSSEMENRIRGHDLATLNNKVQEILVLLQRAAEIGSSLSSGLNYELLILNSLKELDILKV